MTLAREFIDSYSASEPALVPSAPAPSAPKPKIQTKACSALTAKNEPCPRRCCAESPETFCAAHLAQSLKEPKAPKAAAAPKQISKKAARAQVPVCSGKTAKGEPCSRKCCAESDAFCAVHLAQSLKAPKEPKASGSTKKAPAAKKPKAAKATKPVPTHNHALKEEVEENCDLCQSHGNAADPELTETQFEAISGDLQSRLKAILANVNEVEEEETDEAGEKPVEEEELEVEEEETEEEEEETEEEEEEEDLEQFDAGSGSDEEEEIEDE